MRKSKAQVFEIAHLEQQIIINNFSFRPIVEYFPPAIGDNCLELRKFYIPNVHI